MDIVLSPHRRQSSDSSVHPLTPVSLNLQAHVKTDKEKFATGLCHSMGVGYSPFGRVSHRNPQTPYSLTKILSTEREGTPRRKAPASAWHTPHMLTSIPAFLL